MPAALMTPEEEERLRRGGNNALAAYRSNYGPRTGREEQGAPRGGRGMEPIATGGPLQPQAAATPEPRINPPMQEPPVQGALTAATGGAGPTDIDPAKGLEVAKESAEAAKTASAADKKAMNKEMEEMFGKGSLEEAYKEAIKRLGGEKTFDPKLKREDWGLFLMDFGMRMMAASGAWNAQLGGAAGQAGAGALQGMLGRQAGEQERTDTYNEELRGSALDIAKTQRESEETQRKAERDPKNVLWTSKGALNMQTGEYMREDPDDPKSGILQPGMQPGAGNKLYAAQVGAQAIKDSLMAGGLSEEEAQSLGDRMSYGGAPDPAKYYTEVASAFDRLAEKAGIRDKIPGTDIRWRDASPEDKDRWVRQQVHAYERFIRGNRGQEAALTQPGPAAEGRERPSSMNTY